MTDSSDETTKLELLETQLHLARKENEKLQAKLSPPRHTVRRVLAVVLLVAGLAMVLPAEVLLWANRTLTNTNQYVQTVGPIIKEPSVQAALTKASTDALFTRIDINQEVKALLPAQAQALSAPLAGQVKNYLTQTIKSFISSDKFATVWVNVNRSAQEQFMKIAASKNPTGAINVDQLYQVVAKNLQTTSLGFLANHELPPKIGQINVVTIPALAKIPYYVSALATLNWIFLGLSTGLLILALAAATNRAKMAAAIGIGWMSVVVLGVISFRITRYIFLAEIKDPTYQQAASSIWQALLQPLYYQAVVLFLLGLIVAIIGWLMGTSRRAVSWRRGAVRWFSARRHELMPSYDNHSWSRTLRARHTVALWILLVLTVAALLLMVPLTPTTLAVVLIIAGIVWLGYEFLAAPFTS